MILKAPNFGGYGGLGLGFRVSHTVGEIGFRVGGSDLCTAPLHQDPKKGTRLLLVPRP